VPCAPNNGGREPPYRYFFMVLANDPNSIPNIAAMTQVGSMEINVGKAYDVI